MQQNQNMKIKAGVLSKSPANIYTLADLQTAFANMYRLLYCAMLKYSGLHFGLNFQKLYLCLHMLRIDGDIMNRRQIQTKPIDILRCISAFGGDKRIRTAGLLHAKQPLYQLSYTPETVVF